MLSPKVSLPLPQPIDIRTIPLQMNSQNENPLSILENFNDFVIDFPTQHFSFVERCLRCCNTKQTAILIKDNEKAKNYHYKIVIAKSSLISKQYEIYDEKNLKIAELAISDCGKCCLCEFLLDCFCPRCIEDQFYCLKGLFQIQNKTEISFSKFKSCRIGGILMESSQKEAPIRISRKICCNCEPYNEAPPELCCLCALLTCKTDKFVLKTKICKLIKENEENDLGGKILYKINVPCSMINCLGINKKVLIKFLFSPLLTKEQKLSLFLASIVNLDYMYINEAWNDSLKIK